MNVRPMPVLMLLLAGCGGAADDGPERFAVSGTVLFERMPVPKGYIQFSPDTEKGNKGPGSGAEIVNGKFETPPGKGIVGGPHIVEITGTDGVPVTMEGEEVPDGTPLFPRYKTTFDFPKEDSKKEFVVP